MSKKDSSPQGRHTPGPWKAVIAPAKNQPSPWYPAVIAFLGEDGDGMRASVVATQDVRALESNQANALLMAAAPELLDALRDLREWHKGEYHSNDEIDARADAAIAKAEGVA